MKIFHGRFVRDANTTQLAFLGIAAQGTIVSVSAQNQTTPARALQMYCSSMEAKDWAAADYTKSMPLTPAGGNVQASLSDWISWYGEIRLGQDVSGILVDLSNAVANDVIELAVGVNP